MASPQARFHGVEHRPGDGEPEEHHGHEEEEDAAKEEVREIERALAGETNDGDDDQHADDVRDEARGDGCENGRGALTGPASRVEGDQGAEGRCFEQAGRFEPNAEVGPFVAAEARHEQRAGFGRGRGAQMKHSGQEAHALHRGDTQSQFDGEYLAGGEHDEQRRPGCADGVVGQPGPRAPEEEHAREPGNGSGDQCYRGHSCDLRTRTVAAATAARNATASSGQPMALAPEQV